MRVLETQSASASSFSTEGIFMIIEDYEQLKPFKNKSGIYIFFNKKDPTKRYVGKSINLYRRIAIDHKNAKNKNHYIDNVIKKYGLLKYFNIELIHWWDEPIDKLTLLALEAAAIDEYKCLTKFGGYNILSCGTDMRGFKHSEKSKQKISISHKGKIFSKEHRKNLSISLQRRIYSQETKRKMSLNSAKNNLGKKLSQETCLKISIKRRNPIIYKFQNRITNETYMGTRYDFYTKYMADDGDTSKLIKGQLKSVKNWILLS